MLPAIAVSCPYCGETFELLVDLPALDNSAGDQRYIEDCPVCCRPITVVVALDDDGEPRVATHSEDDAA